MRYFDFEETIAGTSLVEDQKSTDFQASKNKSAHQIRTMPDCERMH
jgi:hypothetical protein